MFACLASSHWRVGNWRIMMGMHIRVVYKQCCAVNYGAGHIVTGIQCSVAPIPKYQSDKSNMFNWVGKGFEQRGWRNNYTFTRKTIYAPKAKTAWTLKRLI